MFQFSVNNIFELEQNIINRDMKNCYFTYGL